MKVMELMERVDSTNTGRILAYIKDGLADMANKTEFNRITLRVNINANQRFYKIPIGAYKVTDIRVKDYDNTDGVYQSIPRTLVTPVTEDSDGV